MNFAIPLGVADAAAFDSLVVPRYLSFFGSMVLEMLIPHSPAVIAHIGCRTGYPDGLIAERCPNSSLAGVDCSQTAIELARAKASSMANLTAAYEPAESLLATPLPSGSFTHSFSIHPTCDADSRQKLFAELRRVLVPGGQAVISLPVRGSFPELNDMLREFALRQDLSDLGAAIDAAAASRPTIETLSEELENVGFGEVDVDVQLVAVSFGNGREFAEDPTAKLMVFPDLKMSLHVDPAVIDASLKYCQEAISKYWSEGVFELTVNIGCASGRRFD